MERPNFSYSVLSLLDLDLDPPVPVRTLGDELSPSGTIVGNAPGLMDVTATDTHFLHFKPQLSKIHNPALVFSDGHSPSYFFCSQPWIHF